MTAAKAKLELAKREWIPDPTVSLEAERYNAASQFVSQVGGGVSINVPWLNGKKYRAEEREAQGELSAAVERLCKRTNRIIGIAAEPAGEDRNSSSPYRALPRQSLTDGTSNGGFLPGGLRDRQGDSSGSFVLSEEPS